MLSFLKLIFEIIAIKLSNLFLGEEVGMSSPAGFHMFRSV